MKRRNGTVLARSGRTLREKSATASTIVPITNTPSTQRYGPTGYFPIASAKPTPASASVAAPPSARSRSTEPATWPPWPEWRLAVS